MSVCSVEKIPAAFFGRACVAQVGNLLCRRLPVCGVGLRPAAKETEDFYKADARPTFWRKNFTRNAWNSRAHA
jgi:hypothetical protein